MAIWSKDFTLLKNNIVETKPLVHHITNYVTSGDCANVALCFGASPVMADELEEIDAMTGAAKALVLNIGTINQTKLTSMLRAAEVARSRQIPIVFDPVGVMASSFRQKAAQQILRDGVSIIRGNYAECRCLLGDASFGQGVDSQALSDGQGKFAAKAAQQFGCVVAVTGALDAISDGQTTILATNGVELLTKVTGTGCMTTTLIACAAAVSMEYLPAAVFGITAMNVAAEKAAVQLRAGEGPGTFKAKLFDQIYNLSGDDIAVAFRGVGQNA